jgi:hypothetical protein
VLKLWEIPRAVAVQPAWLRQAAAPPRPCTAVRRSPAGGGLTAERDRATAMAAAPEPRGGSSLDEAEPEVIPVAFPNADGLQLAGHFTRAVPGPGARAAILCHGYAGTQDDMRLPQIAQVVSSSDPCGSCCFGSPRSPLSATRLRKQQSHGRRPPFPATGARGHRNQRAAI